MDYEYRSGFATLINRIVGRNEAGPVSKATYLKLNSFAVGHYLVKVYKWQNWFLKY